MKLIQMLLVIFVVASACGSRSSGKAPKKAVGDSGQPCYADGTCNGSLVCTDDRCQTAPSNNDNVDDNNVNAQTNLIDPNVNINNTTGPNNDNIRTPFCGDGILDPGELCDSDDLNGQDCATRGFEAGRLGCTASCVFDESDCTDDPAFCGDGVADPGELCDGADVLANTCQSLGYTGGSLFCAPNCQGFDDSQCTNIVCGNGVRETGELCDGNDLGGQDCVSRGFGGGTLRCNTTCSDYDTSGCFICGNDVVDPGEQCDMTNLNGQTCLTLGFDGGFLACNGNCTYGTAACTVDGNLVCELIPPTAIFNECDVNDENLCVCEGCVDNGTCESTEDCVCADCQSDANCAACDMNGMCNPYLETCTCADCADHPECQP